MTDHDGFRVEYHIMQTKALAQIAVSLETLAKNWNIVSIQDSAIEGVILTIESADSQRVERLTFDQLAELESKLKAL